MSIGCDSTLNYMSGLGKASWKFDGMLASLSLLLRNMACKDLEAVSGRF